MKCMQEKWEEIVWREGEEEKCEGKEGKKMWRKRGNVNESKDMKELKMWWNDRWRKAGTFTEEGKQGKRSESIDKRWERDQAQD